MQSTKYGLKALGSVSVQDKSILTFTKSDQTLIERNTSVGICTGLRIELALGVNVVLEIPASLYILMLLSQYIRRCLLKKLLCISKRVYTSC